MKNEHILGFEAKVFAGTQADQAKVVGMGQNTLDALADQAVILQRHRAETDENYRHMIPYTLLVNDRKEVLMYRRGSGVGEQRLAGQASVGFGGHVDLHDVRYASSVINLEATLQDACYRELAEELGVERNDFSKLEMDTYILDNSNEVGRVHVGLLTIAHFHPAQRRQLASRESELEVLGWFKPEDIDLEDLEPWSRAAVGYLLWQKLPDIHKFAIADLEAVRQGLSGHNEEVKQPDQVGLSEVELQRLLVEKNQLVRNQQKRINELETYVRSLKMPSIIKRLIGIAA